MFWFKYTDLLLIYSSKIWQIPWHSALNSEFSFYDWIPRFHLRFPHRWIHRPPDFLSLELKGIPLSRIALQLLVTKKSDQKKKKKKGQFFYFCRYMLFTTEYSFISTIFPNTVETLKFHKLANVRVSVSWSAILFPVNRRWLTMQRRMCCPTLHTFNVSNARLSCQKRTYIYHKNRAN